MDNLSDMYYLFQLIVRQIFVYLRDVILHEFGWLGVEYENLDGFESKVKYSQSSRHAVADFAAFFTICTFLGIFVILSAKASKDDDHFTTDSLVDEATRVDLPEDRTYRLPPMMSTTTCKHASGDGCSPSNPMLGKPLGPMEAPRMGPPCEINLPRSAVLTVQTTHSHYSQSTQTTARCLKQASCAQDWLIRRTRSGHVYGKYPM